MSASSITDAERKHLFGEFAWKRTHGDFIDIDDKWEREHIVNVYVPQLKGIPTDGGKCSGHIQWHKYVVPQLLAAWSEVESLGFLGDILQWGGSFVPRVKRGGSTPSNHAYGTAFDVNVEWNFMGEKPALPGQKGSLHRVAPVFKTYGFGWGAEWSGTKDGMHFEALRIVPLGEVEEQDDIKEDRPRGPLLVLNDDWKNAIPITIVNGQSFVFSKALTEARGEKHEGPDVRLPAGQALTSLGYTFSFDNKTKKLYAYKR